MSGNSFKENIYLAAAKIPKGRVTTYARLAELAGYGRGAARAVDNAVPAGARVDMERHGM